LPLLPAHAGMNRWQVSTSVASSPQIEKTFIQKNTHFLFFNNGLLDRRFDKPPLKK
jgi:hypothetical protein